MIDFEQYTSAMFTTGIESDAILKPGASGSSKIKVHFFEPGELHEIKELEYEGNKPVCEGMAKDFVGVKEGDRIDIKPLGAKSFRKYFYKHQLDTIPGLIRVELSYE
jgi:hypothetical protein